MDLLSNFPAFILFSHVNDIIQQSLSDLLYLEWCCWVLSMVSQMATLLSFLQLNYMYVYVFIKILYFSFIKPSILFYCIFSDLFSLCQSIALWTVAKYPYVCIYICIYLHITYSLSVHAVSHTEAVSTSWFIVNNATMNMGIQILLWEMILSPWDIFLEVGLLDNKVVFILIFWGPSILLP